MLAAAAVAVATMAAAVVVGTALGIVRGLADLDISMLHTLAVGRRLLHRAVAIVDMMLLEVRKVSVTHIGAMLVLVDIRVKTASQDV